MSSGRMAATRVWLASVLVIVPALAHVRAEEGLRIDIAAIDSNRALSARGRGARSTLVRGVVELEGTPILEPATASSRDGTFHVQWRASDWPAGLYDVEISSGGLVARTTVIVGDPEEVLARRRAARLAARDALEAVASGRDREGIGAMLSAWSRVSDAAARDQLALARLRREYLQGGEAQMAATEVRAVLALDARARLAYAIRATGEMAALASTSLTAVSRFRLAVVEGEAIDLARDAARDEVSRPLLERVARAASLLASEARARGVEVLALLVARVERARRDVTALLVAALRALDDVEVPSTPGRAKVAVDAVDAALASDLLAIDCPGAREDLAAARRCLAFRRGGDPQLEKAMRFAFDRARERLRVEVARR